ncbi:MAG: enoyl-CoA hydratase/isomerase family protein [Eubacterium sp.]|nr:enoyl-CoA hydratase/isomerase family protein [Eubacterium sp.]
MNRVVCTIENHIAVVTLDNASHANCLTAKMMDELCRCVKELERDASVRCVILTSSGEKAFCSGGDLKEELHNATEDPQQLQDFNRLGCDMIQRILQGRLPYIAAVKGYALGAAPAILSSCDIVIGAENSVYGMPTTSLGGIPGWGSTQLVPRVMGRQAVLRMMLLNQKFTADEALRYGLISEICPADRILDRAKELASVILSFSGSAVAAARRSVNRTLDLPLASGLELEDQLLKEINTGADFAEGMRAFLEKRKPHFDQKSE